MNYIGTVMYSFYEIFRISLRPHVFPWSLWAKLKAFPWEPGRTHAELQVTADNVNISLQTAK